MGIYKDIDLESKSRRDFIKAGAVFMGGMWFFPAMSTQVSPKNLSSRQDLPWFQQPLRIMHTVLRETDAQDYDVDIVTDYVLKSGANALCVNAGGITDFWQNPKPFPSDPKLYGISKLPKNLPSSVQLKNRTL